MPAFMWPFTTLIWALAMMIIFSDSDVACQNGQHTDYESIFQEIAISKGVQMMSISDSLPISRQQALSDILGDPMMSTSDIIPKEITDSTGRYTIDIGMIYFRELRADILYTTAVEFSTCQWNTDRATFLAYLNLIRNCRLHGVVRVNDISGEPIQGAVIRIEENLKKPDLRPADQPCTLLHRTHNLVFTYENYHEHKTNILSASNMCNNKLDINLWRSIHQ